MEAGRDCLGDFCVIYVRDLTNLNQKNVCRNKIETKEFKNIQEVEWIGLGGDQLYGDRGE